MKKWWNHSCWYKEACWACSPAGYQSSFDSSVSESYRWDVHVARPNVNWRNNVPLSGYVLNVHKSHGKSSGNHPRRRKSRSGERKHLAQDVVRWKAFFLSPIGRLWLPVQSSSEQDCLVAEPQCRHGSIKLSVTSGISHGSRATCRLPLKLSLCQSWISNYALQGYGVPTAMCVCSLKVYGRDGHAPPTPPML